MKYISTIPLILILILSLSCSGLSGNKSKKDTKSPYPIKVQKSALNKYKVDAKGNRYKEYDLDSNKRNDTKVFYNSIGQIQKIERDANENGIKEKVIYYKYSDFYNRSRKYKEHYDDNEDGYLDGERVFDGNTLKSSWFDTDFNRKPDIWKKAGKYDKLIIKIDSDGDGVNDVGGDHIVTGNAKRSQHLYQEAFKEYKKTLNFNSRSSMAYWGMALSLEGMNNYEMAIKHYERYIMLLGGGKRQLQSKAQAKRKIAYLKKHLKRNFRK
ncbi:MAG: hypothetical protein COA79_00310 [Planctomycetota bacterium]|nr:MAG: hypothetical protein COA79_00310 [Planctomycetota bacterium]